MMEEDRQKIDLKLYLPDPLAAIRRLLECRSMMALALPVTGALPRIMETASTKHFGS
jgi:hypothetical protein